MLAVILFQIPPPPPPNTHTNTKTVQVPFLKREPAAVELHEVPNLSNLQDKLNSNKHWTNLSPPPPPQKKIINTTTTRGTDQAPKDYCVLLLVQYYY